MTSNATCTECGETFNCRDTLEVCCGCDRDAAREAAREAINAEFDRLPEEPAADDCGGFEDCPW